LRIGHEKIMVHMGCVGLGPCSTEGTGFSATQRPHRNAGNSARNMGGAKGVPDDSRTYTMTFQGVTSKSGRGKGIGKHNTDQ